MKEFNDDYNDYNEYSSYNEEINHSVEEESKVLASEPHRANTSINENDIVKAEEKPKKKHSFKKGVALTAIVALASFGGGSLYTSYQWMEKYEAEANKVTLAAPSSNSNIVQTASTSKTSGFSVTQIANKAADSVVEIRTEGVSTDQFFGQFVTQGAGSGVAITKDGYIVTNNHVIEGAKTITVRLTNGKEYKAKLIGTDTQTDVAVIKVDNVTLKPIQFGNSDKLIVGEEVAAIGNPLGELGGTVTNGIISALDREITISGRTMTLLQTNAAINPGNSGGGLFNGNAELIGLVVAKSSGSDVEGLGFAIPANKVNSIAESLINEGYVAGRPALGVSIVDATSWETAIQYNVQQGIYIADLAEAGKAEKAGLKVGDSIVAIEDTEITSVGDISNELEKHKVGDTVSITVSREGKLVNIKLPLSELKPSTQAK